MPHTVTFCPVYALKVFAKLLYHHQNLPVKHVFHMKHLFLDNLKMSILLVAILFYLPTPY